jgi:hypothetical protein
MHYLSNCSGFFAPSTSNRSLLSSNKINITCTRQISSYTFTPREVVASQLKQSVKALAGGLNNDTYKTGVWVSLWYSGIGNCVLTSLLLPWNFKRQANWVSSGTFWQSFVRATWPCYQYLSRLLSCFDLLFRRLIIVRFHRRCYLSPQRSLHLMQYMCTTRLTLLAQIHIVGHSWH